MKMKNKGIIAVNKPKDWTSFDVVNKIKHLVRPLKVGHLGTLDPMATGVLLVTVGKATKLFDLMQEKKKTYIATFEFGYTTDTLDAVGTKLDSTSIIPTKDEIERELKNFIGVIDQIPPQFSAKSVNGVRAYEMARKGISVELKSKKVIIYDIKLISYNKGVLKLEIECGSGTYIRSIGRDLALNLNSLATMTNLVRSKVGNVELDACIDVQNLNKDNILEQMMPLDQVINYPVLNVDEIVKTRLLNGLTQNINLSDGEYLLKEAGDVQAIVKINNNVAKMSIFLG
ncbi:MAG: tRNA pseudouridine(55) synthase TruB [Clostridiales bacterium]|nr:tRNA pseudouridine(55) synthase TruB [Clostridiales bacterium]